MDSVLLENFANHLTFERQLSRNTVASYTADVAHFLEYCAANEVRPEDVSANFIEQYNYQLLGIEHLAPASAFRKMEAVKSFYKFLMIEEKIQDDPTRFVKSPKLAQKIPTQLSREEMSRLLSFPATNFEEIRTVTIIELLYAAGLRVSELLALRLENINTEENWVLAFGKGGKQRFVPIHPSCVTRLKAYLAARAAHFNGKEVDSEVFLNNRGKKLSRVTVWKDLAALGRKANISQPLHPHLFRHTFASHLLQGGADLRSLQEMLGHANLTTTQIYTHLDVSDLKNKHKKYHPRG